MFQFDLTEPLGREIRHIVLDELKDADEALAGGEGTLAERVHEARKRLKRLRAVLSLIAGNAPPEAIAAISEQARSAAQILAAPRGNAALLHCLDDLEQKNPAGASKELRRELEGRAARSTLDAGEYLEQARERLRDARSAAKELGSKRDGFPAIADGFRKTYRKAQRALVAARELGRASDFHAFRKPSKRHFYQLRLLEGVWPALLQAQANEVDQLGELLGEHHDLCLLSLELAKIVPGEAERELSRNIEQRVNELESDVLSRGARCFAERPSAITRRIGRYFALAAG